MPELQYLQGCKEFRRDKSHGSNLDKNASICTMDKGVATLYQISIDNSTH